ncbi:ring finger protein-like [Dendropsophus ebraccatus]|uniref:ring finger protein-like n=1 Tax=Dendropsophus ebraccatus TaxID=150705 RepID=UPI0038322563
MDEPQATCEEAITTEELTASPQDFTNMTKPIVTCGDVRAAKLGKKVKDQGSELVEDPPKGGKLHTITSIDGPLEELVTDPCKVDIETLSVDPCISYHVVDSCVIITEIEEDTTVVDHGSSQTIDNHGVDLVHGVPKAVGSQVEEDEDHENKMEVNECKEVAESSQPLLKEDNPEQECPICTEPYDTTRHKQSLLNCNHIFCDNCIKTMINTANRVNVCRLTCPMCRQTTPMLEWEVRRMQEQMMESGGVCVQEERVPALPPLVRRHGLCGSLEYRFYKRFHTGRLFPPCIRNPQRLLERMVRLRHRCRCMYFVALVFLLFAEFFCFAFLFLPILVFILMIVLGK